MTVVVNVSTSGLPVIAEDDRIDELASSVELAILQDEDITTAIDRVTYSGLAYQSRVFAGWVKHYHPLGLPKADFTSQDYVTQDKFLDYLEQAEGTPVRAYGGFKTFKYFGTISSDDLLWGPLGTYFEAQGWDYHEDSRELRNPPTSAPEYTAGFPVKLSRTQPPAWVGDDTVELTLDYFYGSGLTDYVAVTTQVVVPFRRDVVYYFVKYQTDYDYRHGEASYFIYDRTTQQIPALDTIVVPESVEADYLPHIPLRINKERVSDIAPEISKANSTALTFMSLNYDDIDDEVHNNPDIANIDDAYLVYGIDLNTQTKHGINYLIEFFKALEPYQQVDATDFANWLVNANIGSPTDTGGIASNVGLTQGPVNEYRIETSGTGSEINKQKTNLSCEITWNYIKSSKRTGTLAEPTNVITPLSYTFENGNQSYQTASLKLERQIGDNLIETVQVVGLLHGTYIGNFLSLDRYTYITAAQTLDDPEDRGFWVPINGTVLREFAPNVQGMLLQEGLTLYVTAVVKTDLDWYETPSFLALLQIVVVVVAIITFQPQIAGLAGASLAVAVEIIVTILLEIYLARLIVEFLIKEVGLGGTILALLIYAYFTGDLQSFIDTFTETVTSMEFWSNLISATDSLYGIYTQTRIAEMQDDYAEFLNEAEQLQNEIEAMEAMLQEPSEAYQQYLSNQIFRPESPESFLSRTLDVDAWENMLNLPELYIESSLKATPDAWTT